MASKLLRNSSNQDNFFKQVNCCRAGLLITSLVIATIGVALIVTIKKEYRFIVSISCSLFFIGLNSAGYLYIRSLKKVKPADVKPAADLVNPIEIITKDEEVESFSYNNSGGPTYGQACMTDGGPVAFVSVKDIFAPLPSDLREFYQFLKPSEIEAIQNCEHPPLQNEIIAHIQKGEWAKLVLCYQTFNNPDLFYNILNGIFLQGKLDQVDDLVTADMAISNSRASVDGNCKMVTYEEAKCSRKWKDFAGFSNIEGVPENQLYFFEMNLQTMTNEQRSLVSTLFDIRKHNHCVIGALQENGRYLFASAALKRRDSRLTGLVRYTYKLPRRSKVCKYILNKENVFSVLYPKDEEKFLIHGQHLIGLLGHAHDGYHANERAQENLFEMTELVNMGIDIEEVLQPLPRYRKGILLTRGMTNRGLAKEANDLEKARFFLEEISQRIIDAENLASYLKKPTIGDHLMFIIKGVINSQNHLRSFATNHLSSYLQKVGYEIIPGSDFKVRRLTTAN